MLRTVYCGTPDFAVPTLQMLAKNPLVELVGVISMPDRPADRGMQNQPPPVALAAKELKLNLIQTENINRHPESLALLEDKIDLVVVLAFAQFLGDKVLKAPRLGCFNIHASLLPRHRGAAPIQYSVLKGDHESGISIQKMVKKMDAGDVAIAHPLLLTSRETGASLYERLKIQAAESCRELIEKLQSAQLSFTPQDESQVSFAPSIKKEEGLVDFLNSSYLEIDRKVRAFFPWPGTYCFLDKKRLKILEVLPGESKLTPGQWSIQQGQFLVGTKDGSVRLARIQLEGKKAVSDTEFINGMKGATPNFSINPRT